MVAKKESATLLTSFFQKSTKTDPPAKSVAATPYHTAPEITANGVPAIFRSLPSPWVEALGEDQLKGLWSRKLSAEVEKRYIKGVVFPPRDQIFNAFERSCPDDVRVVILGQDPYHGEGQAMGLSFSVPEGLKIPPSLQNMYKEIGYSKEDVKAGGSLSGDLSAWADQGVFLLNTVLTVDAHKANSHQKLGWETFTDLVIKRLSQKGGVIFLLWGKPAQTKASFINQKDNLVLMAGHPSPLSAHKHFFGCDHFKKVNAYLEANGKPIIKW